MAEEGSGEIRATLIRLLAAYNAGDAETAAESGLLEWRLFGTAASPDPVAQRARLAAAFDAGLRTDLHWRHLYVRVYGEVAIASGYIGGWVCLPGAPPVQGTWRFHRVWTRHKGAWRMDAPRELSEGPTGLLEAAPP